MALVFTALAGLGFFLRGNVRLPEAFRTLRPGRLLLALAIIAAISVVLSVYPTNSFRFFRRTYFGVFLFAVFTVAAIRSFRDVERIVLVYLVGAVLYSVRVVLTFEVMGRRERLDNLISYDANDFAMVLVCTIPLAIYFLRRGARPWQRILALGAVILFVVALVQTGSRGGFLGFLAVLLFLLFRFRAVSKRVRIAAVSVGVATLLLAGSEGFWSQMQTLLNPTEDYNFSGQSASGRMEIWKRGVDYMVQRPTGWGIYNFSSAEGRSELNRLRTAERKGWINESPHNSFVQVGVELGVAGLVVFVWLLAATIRALGRIPRAGPDGRPRAEAALGQALIGSFIAYGIIGFFLTQGYATMLYGLLGLAIGLLKLEQSAVTATPRTGRSVQTRTLPAFGRTRAVPGGVPSRMARS
jgi:O-antigen ligase